MKHTDDFIANLAADGTAVRVLPSPAELILKLSTILILYAVAVLALMGVREDLDAQLTRAVYVAEIAMLLALAATSLSAMIYRVFPDHYQDARAGTLALGTLTGFLVLLVFQFFFPSTLEYAATGTSVVHDMECTLCITAIAALPSFLAVRLLRKGASTQPFSAVAFAVLAATAVGCLVLRLSEMNDDPWHLIAWHYAPIFLYALAGGIIGRILLRW